MTYIVKTTMTLPEDTDQVEHVFNRMFTDYAAASEFYSTVSMLIIAHRQSFSAIPLTHTMQNSDDKTIIIETNQTTNSTYPLASTSVMRNPAELN